MINIISDLSEGNLNPNDYSDNIDVDTAGSYAYKNALLADKNSDNNYLTHSAKLFVMDWTNIRGTTPQEVGSSKQTNWKVTTV